MPKCAAACLALLSSASVVAVATPASRVLVEQFGMVQCTMTSTWLNHFHQTCLVDGSGIAEIVNFTEFFVGGKHGGPVDDSSWNTSFHGPQEIVGDKYHLCARVQAGAGAVPLDVNRTWTDFEACTNGPFGILEPWVTPIPTAAEKCAEKLGLDWAKLDACANGDEGTALYKESVFYTSGQGINYVAGKIPVIRINGTLYDGLDAYSKLGERICAAYTGAGKPDKCGCGKGLSDPGAPAAAKAAAAQATVTVTHYSDAQCPCSARAPNDVQTTFLSEESGFDGAVNFEQYFVGDLHKDVSKCIHGEGECVGQRHFACAQNMSVRGDEWIAFETCSYGKCTGCAAIEGKHCPCETYTSFTEFSSNDIMKGCAATAGLEWDDLHACGTGADGQALMEASSTRSNDDGITYGADGLAPIYVDGVKVKTKQLIPVVCGPTPKEVKAAVCSALAAKGATPAACA